MIVGAFVGSNCVLAGYRGTDGDYYSERSFSSGSNVDKPNPSTSLAMADCATMV
jgi:hypothetical protein